MRVRLCILVHALTLAMCNRKCVHLVQLFVVVVFSLPLARSFTYLLLTRPLHYLFIDVC